MKVDPKIVRLCFTCTPEEIENLKTHYVNAYTQPLLPALFQTAIRADEAYEQAVDNCEAVITCYPESKTVNDYIALTREILSLFGLYRLNN